MKIKDAVISEETIEKAVQKDREDQEELQKKAIERKLKRDILEGIREKYLHSDERNMLFEQTPAMPVATDKDPFFRIPIDQVKDLLTDDKATAIKTYHNWKRPEINGKKVKKEFIRNAQFVDGSDPKKGKVHHGRNTKTKDNSNQSLIEEVLEDKKPSSPPKDQTNPPPKTEIVAQAGEKAGGIKKSPNGASEATANGSDSLSPSKDQAGRRLSKSVNKPANKLAEGEKRNSKMASKSKIVEKANSVDTGDQQPAEENPSLEPRPPKGIGIMPRQDKHAQRYPVPDDWQLSSKKKEKSKVTLTTNYEPDKGELPLATYYHRKTQLESIIRSKDDFVFKMDNV